ncbi:right-handed parallel beta-helix repeat-containing protein [Nonomuraea guangzhouensis]|uniref:Right-handed parallel beta-helix repeat-containing protein n=1 Tax=Nonomuraea guangzhouensis TaxID=1291555 RepID=A0ABW4G2P6_9ACTN|nr:right-handed parallel beta-helix repeat-containing protein [Nonomuraea guangzhouensis]
MHKSVFTLVSATVLALAATGIAVIAQPTPAEAARKEVQCTGTDDATIINNAITASKAGDEIVILGRSVTAAEPAVCVINKTIVLRGDRTYRGDSRTGLRIKQADSVNLPALLASDTWDANQAYSGNPIRVERLTLDGNRAKNTTGTVGLMLRSWGSRISDIQIEQTSSDAIRLSNPSKNGTTIDSATNTMVNGVISDVYITGSGGAGVKVLDPDGGVITDWTFTRSWVRDSGTSAVESDNAAGWLLSDLHLYGNASSALDLNRCFGTSIQGNYIEDFGYQATTAEAWLYGIRCVVQEGATTTISNNKIHNFRDAGKTPPTGPHYYYIALDGVDSGAGNVVVTGNAILGNGTADQTGLQYEKKSGASLTVVSTGNLVKNVTKPLVKVPNDTTVTVNAGL